MNQGATWRFRLFNIPVSVNITFFIIAVFLGLQIRDFLRLFLWVVIVFVSILLHELGHAFASSFYGRAPSIELRWSGGLTSSARYSMLSYPKEIFISFAGPLAGFLFGALLFLLKNFLGPVANAGLLGWLIQTLLWVNIGWGVLNLIPVLPLDGGMIMRNAYHWLRSPYDDRTPYIISIGFGILAIIAVLVIFSTGGLYFALILALLTFNNYTALKRGYWSDSIF
jgi:stage IV sporulation protein FB